MGWLFHVDHEFLVAAACAATCPASTESTSVCSIFNLGLDEYKKEIEIK